jgi:hypothetical protein
VLIEDWLAIVGEGCWPWPSSAIEAKWTPFESSNAILAVVVVVVFTVHSSSSAAFDSEMPLSEEAKGVPSE